jgi:hypothetical protein
VTSACTALRRTLQRLKMIGSAWPELGRTAFEASRLIFGCGAALSRRPNDALLDAAFDAGIKATPYGRPSITDPAMGQS